MSGKPSRKAVAKAFKGALKLKAELQLVVNTAIMAHVRARPDHNEAEITPSESFAIVQALCEVAGTYMGSCILPHGFASAVQDCAETIIESAVDAAKQRFIAYDMTSREKH